MALTFFETEDTNDSLDLEFYGDWIAVDTAKKLKKPVPYPVVQILRAKSGKGYMVSTTHFNCWLWKNSKLCKQIIEALQHYVKNGGYKLFVVPKNNKPDGYSIAVDKEISQLWYTDGKKYTLSEIPEELETDMDTNPYM